MPNKRRDDVNAAIDFLSGLDKSGRNLQLPGDGRYQPDELKGFLGYDQWAGWLIMVEWFWMKVMGMDNVQTMPKDLARELNPEVLNQLLASVTTTMQDNREYGRDGKPGTNHDINALIAVVKESGILPVSFHPWFHRLATSYDPISTAYALVASCTYERVFWPLLTEIDQLWREKILQYKDTLQIGRTHLQHALPITAGFWLANLHNRFVGSARHADVFSREISSKFSGGVGTFASQRAFTRSGRGLSEKYLLYALGLQPAAVSTQIAPPESTARFYHELVLLTGVLANLGDDVRKLVAPEYGEIVIGKAAASTSSTMAQKVSNPIAAEQLCGLHVNVLAEHQKVLLTLISDFQRDLRWSSVMRSYSAIMVYAFQQLKTCLRLLKNMSVNAEACQVNFQKSASLLTAEVMHLALQDRGYSSSHAMVNAVLVPKAREKNCSLGQAIDYIISNDEVSDSYNLGQSWKAVPADLKELIDHPENYLGFASEIACEEANNSL